MLVHGDPKNPYERYHDDPLRLLNAYRHAGLEVYQLRISPYDCPYSLRRASP